MAEYPEHDKLKAIKDESQAQGELLDWLASQGINLMVWKIHQEQEQKQCWRCVHFTKISTLNCDCITCHGTHEYTSSTTVEGWSPINKSIPDLLAEYHKIDLKKLDQEKQIMLTELQELGEDVSDNENDNPGPIQRPSRTS